MIRWFEFVFEIWMKVKSHSLKNICSFNIITADSVYTIDIQVYFNENFIKMSMFMYIIYKKIQPNDIQQAISWIKGKGKINHQKWLWHNHCD